MSKTKSAQSFHHFAILDMPYDDCIRCVADIYDNKPNVEPRVIDEDRLDIVYWHNKQSIKYAVATIMRWQGTQVRVTLNVSHRDSQSRETKQMLWVIWLLPILWLILFVIGYGLNPTLNEAGLFLWLLVSGLIAVIVVEMRYGFVSQYGIEGEIWSDLMDSLADHTNNLNKLTKQSDDTLYPDDIPQSEQSTSKRRN